MDAFKQLKGSLVSNLPVERQQHLPVSRRTAAVPGEQEEQQRDRSADEDARPPQQLPDEVARGIFQGPHALCEQH